MGVIQSAGAADMSRLLIQRGRDTTDSGGLATVAFEVPFAGTPEVALQVRGTTADVPLTAKITRLAATGFDVAIMRLDGTQRMAAGQVFSWIAVGER